MPSIIAISKFVGTISLGLLTGVSYTLSTQSLPSLLTLPTAKPAAYTLAQTTRLATLHVRSLSTLSATAFLTAFYFSPTPIRHPYLIWTALVAGASGGLSFVMGGDLDARWTRKEQLEDVNGEEVEKSARSWQLMEGVRTAVAGVGFAMGVVGIWGDGA